MADSNVTKRALATAMKQLMAKEPFSKISVGDICQVCQMNRKSFYYHFRDKYDLVNWHFEQLAQRSFKQMGAGLTLREALIKKAEFLPRLLPGDPGPGGPGLRRGCL